jgi:UDP-N-acetylmuramoyl-tripeptide--D-alanyl-D-alanine ligase
MWRPFKRQALLGLANLHRRRFQRGIFIGVTGSCGKTTTKTLLADILSGFFHVAQNPDSENRLGTAAKTILKTPLRGGVCIQEFGVSGVGSLDRMASLFQPNMAIVTNIMRDHFTAFRSLEAIASEKSKLVAALPAGGVAVLNGDDPLVAAMAGRTRARVVTYGFSPSVDLQCLAASSVWPARLSLSVAWQGERHDVRTRLVGEHWAPIVMAAMAAALVLGIPASEIVQTLAAIEPPNGRYSVVEIPDGPIFICDDFKSPMHSVPPALSVLKEAAARRKVALFGHISDYSSSSSRKYKAIADKAVRICDRVLFVNRFASPKLFEGRDLHHGRILCFDDLKSAAEHLTEYLQPGDVVLLKGIRKKDHLERVPLNFGYALHCWRSNCGHQWECPRCPTAGPAMETRDRKRV